MQCPTCKKMLEDGLRFCPHDGTPLTETSAATAMATPTGGRVPASQEIALPAVVGGRYRLEEVRGGGGMAKVYRAIDQTLDREVAVKLINPALRSEAEFDARFQREARIASQLADPHIVVVHDFGIDGTYGPFLVMEYLHGQSLRERLQQGGPLPLKAGLQLSAQLLLALIHAHGKGIVHRDIKPDNIFLLNQSGVRLHVRVLDFGIARIFKREEAGRSETLTHAGAVLGTPRYMSPEQLAGQPVDVRSDIYSAALVIHEALTGQMPYVGGKALTELCPDASPALQELLDQCLKPNPSERPPTAVEVYLRLQELGKASGILLLPPGAMDRLVAARKQGEPTIPYHPPPPGKLLTRRRVLLGGAGLLLLAGAGVGGWWLTRKPQHKNQPESVLGVRLDDPQAEALDRLGVQRSRDGDPWKARGAVPAQLAALLRPEDLDLPAEKLNDLETWWTADGQVWVIFHKDRVRAVGVHGRPMETGRGVAINGEVGEVFERYPEPAEQAVVALPGGARTEVRRYRGLGLTFEFQGARVTGVALYPAKP